MMLDEYNEMIDLENQDRNEWNQELIRKGISYLQLSIEQNEISIYHILATISAHHCTAKDFRSTDWKSILSLYDNLIEFDPLNINITYHQEESVYRPRLHRVI